MDFFLHNEYAFLAIVLSMLSTLAFIFNAWRSRLGGVPYFTALKVIGVLFIRQSSNSVQGAAFQILTTIVVELVSILLLLPILELP